MNKWKFLLLVLLFFLHSSYLDNGFVWLDHRDIEAGRVVLPLDQLPSALFTRFGDTGFYRPLVAVTESTDQSLYGAWASGYHLTNVLLHLIVVGLVPLFLSLFFALTFFESLFVMLLVGVHPFGWLPVGAISYRPELLMTIFVLLTIYLHSKARTSKGSVYAFSTILSLFCALLSKETALFLTPAIIFLWEVGFRISRVPRVPRVSKVSQVSGVSRAWPGGLSLFVSEFIVVVLYIFLRFQAVPEVWRVPHLNLSLGEAIGTRLGILCKLLFQFTSPFTPNLSDAVMVRGLDISLVLGCLAMLLISVVIIKKAGVFSSGSKALFLCVITLVPALSIVPVPRLGSPHYGYIALVGFAALFIVLMRFSKKMFPTLKNILCVAWIFWILIMCYTCFAGGFQFKNDLTLFTTEVQKDPHFLEGYFYLGNYHLLHNEPVSAQEAYRKALQIQPQFIAYSERDSAIINLVVVWTKQKDYKKIADLLHNKKGFEDNPQVLLLLANALHHLGRDQERIGSKHVKVEELIKAVPVDLKKK